MLLFLLHHLVSGILSAIHVLPHQAFIQALVHIFLFMLLDLAVFPFLCDLLFVILPYISPCFQHSFSFKVNTSFIQNCIDPLHCKSFCDLSFNDWLFFIGLSIRSFDKLYNTPPPPSNLHIFTNIFDTLHSFP